MQIRFIGIAVTLALAISPAFADTVSVLPNSSTQTTVAPSNSQYVNPTTNQSASTQNVSTQINNENLGANSYGQGITCQAPQIALGGYGARESSGVGLPNSDTGFSVQYLTPLGASSTRSCQSLADEVLKQRKLDTQLTMIQKCADFARAGIVLDQQTYPELARACAGIRLSTSPAASVPVQAYPRSVSPAAVRDTSMLGAKAKYHLSDFSPAHNSELRRVAMHRLQRVAMLQGRAASHHLSKSERVAVAQGLNHENARLRAVIAEYQLETAFLHRIAHDSSWHLNQANADLRNRVLSANSVPQQG